MLEIRGPNDQEDEVCSTFVKGVTTELNTQGSSLALEIRNTNKQQRPESPTVTLTWHACRYKVHKLHQRYIHFTTELSTMASQATDTDTRASFFHPEKSMLLKWFYLEQL